MYPTHNVGTFLRLLEWFSEAQLLYPTIINNRESGCLLYDSWNKQILWNYSLELFQDEINNVNKNHYGDFHIYTEAKSAFILAEERKSIKTNKSSETKKSKDNISRAANSGKNKESKKKKKDHQINTNSSVNKNPSMKCTYCGHDGHFAIKC